ncbi:MAG: hypothetical protein QXI16_07450, partial [Sulfolobaceae archaeon]
DYLMMKKIIKRVVIGVLVSLILGMINSHALTTDETINRAGCLTTYVRAYEITPLTTGSGQSTTVWGIEEYMCSDIEENWYTWADRVYTKNTYTGQITPSTLSNVFFYNELQSEPNLNGYRRLTKGGHNDVAIYQIAISSISFVVVGGLFIYFFVNRKR